MEPKNDDVWLHRATGKRYEILNYGISEKNLVPVVIYRELGKHGGVWVRPCYEFFDGRFERVARHEEGGPTASGKMVLEVPDHSVPDRNPQVARRDTRPVPPRGRDPVIGVNPDG